MKLFLILFIALFSNNSYPQTVKNSDDNFINLTNEIKGEKKPSNNFENDNTIDKKSGKTKSVLSKQIKYGLDKIKIKTKLFIAYEPVWSIGTGKILKPSELNQAIKFIKSKFKKKSPQILYGGSVNTNNINNLKNIKGLNGFLIGGASQNAKNFIDIVKKTYN